MINRKDMTFVEIVDTYVHMVLANPDKSLDTVFNVLSRQLTVKEVKEIGDQSLIVIKAGEAARGASVEIQRMLCACRKSEDDGKIN